MPFRNSYLKRSSSLALSMVFTITTITQLSYAEPLRTNPPTNPGADNRTGGAFHLTNPITSGNNGVAGQQLDLSKLVEGAKNGSGATGSTPNADGGIPNFPGGGTDIGSGTGSGTSVGSTVNNLPADNRYTPWNPYESFRGGRPGMLALTESKMPGIACPLVDNRPNVEILQAVNQLFQFIIPNDPCMPQKEGSEIGELSKNMRESGVALKDLRSALDNGTLDPHTLDLNQVQNHIQNLVSGMSRVGEIIKTSPLSNNAQCGQTHLKGAELIKAMGNLVTSIAPFALVLASLGTGGTATPALLAGASATGATGTAATAAAVAKPFLSMKPTLGLLLGTFGIGTIADIYGKMSESHTMDLKKPDQQEALLQNLCEFFRIEQRVNYLKLSEMGSVTDLTQRLTMAKARLNDYTQKAYGTLSNLYPKEVFSLAEREGKLADELNGYRRALMADKQEMVEINKLLGSANGGNAGAMCSLGKMLARKANDKTTFPGRTLGAYKTLLEKQKKTIVAQEMMKNAEEDLRASLLKAGESESVSQCAPGTQCKPFEHCAAIAKDYVGNLQNILMDGENRVGVLISSLTQQFDENPTYREFKQTQASLRREIAIRENTGKIVALLKGNNASIVREQIDYQMSIMKRTLFNVSARDFFGNAYSPVLAWLMSSEEEMRLALTAYKAELKQIYTYAKDAASPQNERYKSLTERNKLQLAADKSIQTLGMINAKDMAPGSERAVATCQSLSTLNRGWHTLLNHLKAQQFFCDSIAPMRDITFEKRIINFCYGDVNPLNGAVKKQSEIADHIQELGKDFGSHAKLIAAKFKEIQCEVKDPQVMNAK